MNFYFDPGGTIQLKNWSMVIATGIAAILGTIVFDALGSLFMGAWDVPNALAGTLETGLAMGALFH